MSDTAPPVPEKASSTMPEMRRPCPIGRIGNGTRVTVEATPDERRALAARMGLAAIHSLTCRFDLRRGEMDGIDAACLLRARVRQTCVVSLEPFDADVVESFSLRFVPEDQLSEDLDLDADDEVGYSGAVLELGEAASEQLALALDPFPRKPGAELPASIQAPESSPFAGLGKLLPPH